MHTQSPLTDIGYGMTMSGANSVFPSVPDAMFESAVDCFVCDKKFHAFRRKHRCRVRTAWYLSWSFDTLRY